jgi:creatinine amidohydrolase
MGMGTDAKQYSVFADSMADMTYEEVASAARDGAVVLWGLGVIEEHGPHLPLGTDVYIPTAVLRRVRAIFKERGIASVIVPPFCWGVNKVTGRFPGTFQVRPEIMVELMLDVYASLRKDGFDNAYCLSGHGDLAHIRTIHAAAQLGRSKIGIASHILVAPAIEARLSDGASDPSIVVYDPPSLGNSKFLDIHAGEWETSQMWASFPALVRDDVAKGLKSTDLGQQDLEVWRRGDEHAVRTTPQGYFGDPAAARPERGALQLEQQAQAIAAAIIGRRNPPATGR